MSDETNDPPPLRVIGKVVSATLTFLGEPRAVRLPDGSVGEVRDIHRHEMGPGEVLTRLPEAS